MLRVPTSFLPFSQSLMAMDETDGAEGIAHLVMRNGARPTFMADHSLISDRAARMEGRESAAFLDITFLELFLPLRLCELSLR